jgi:hypothetical protein
MLGKLAAIVMRRLKAGEKEMSNPSLYEETGIDRSNFGRLVKKPEWKTYIPHASPHSGSMISD